MDGLLNYTEENTDKDHSREHVDAVRHMQDFSAVNNSNQIYVAFAKVMVPPTPLDVQPDDVTINRIKNFHINNNRERDIVTTIKNYKSFLNPYKLKEVIDYFSIDETASEYPKGTYDPSYDETEYIDAILARLTSRM